MNHIKSTEQISSAGKKKSSPIWIFMFQDSYLPIY